MDDMLALQRSRYRRSSASALQQLVAAFASSPNVERAIVFGSYADGRRHLFTAQDVLVSTQSPLDSVTRAAQLCCELAAPVDLDLLAYNPHQLAKNRHRPLVRLALQKGAVIHEKSTS